MAFEEAHDVVARTASAPIVLTLLLLNLVQQVQGLVEVSSVGAPEVSTLKQPDFVRFCIVVLVEKDVKLANCVS